LASEQAWYAFVALVASLAASALLFAASGALSYKGGSSSGLARKPFTGGVPLPLQRYWYYSLLLAFVALFLVAEALAILLLFAPRAPLTAAFAVLGVGGVAATAAAFQKRRVEGRS